MPWLSDELSDWDELTEEERERFRRAIEELGVDASDDDEDGYYE